MNRKDYYSFEYTQKYSGINRHLEQRELKALKIINDLALPLSAEIFDAGCGDGKFLFELGRNPHNSHRYSGAEYSSDRCSQARENTDYKIFEMDFEKGLDIPSNQYDCIYSGEVIEHLYNPDNMLIELNRIMKPSGTLILTTPNMNSWISRLVFLFGMQPINYECSTVSSTYGYGYLKKFKKQDWPVGHVRLFNYLSLQDIVNDNGFEVQKISGAVFEFIPKYLKTLDKLFAFFPRLSSGLICVASKKSL
jgi:2-polyprenyl-3-methyl-5-hydroxy-6-metoxy-1,4-benzoquinol methylase